MQQRLVFLALLVLPSLSSAEIPEAIPHQGRVAVGGVNDDGTGQFRFLLFLDSDGDQNSGNESALWSNADKAPPNLNQLHPHQPRPERDLKNRGEKAIS